MKILKNGQRVLVKDAQKGGSRVGTAITINALGVVERVCSYGAGWVELDERSKVLGVHPFPQDDERGRRVLVWPEQCELPKTNGRERRKAVRAGVQVRVLGLSSFGRDHWSTFAYLETRTVDYGGAPDRAHMRCDPDLHPLLAAPHHRGGPGAKKYPTRLRGDVELQDHDDWSCVDDLMAEGLLVNVGTNVNPVYELTELGRPVAARLRAHKAAGGNFRDFDPEKLDQPEKETAACSTS